MTYIFSVKSFFKLTNTVKTGTSSCNYLSLCHTVVSYSNRQSGQSSPRLAPHVSPHPDTGLTYIQRGGWVGATQTALKPDQLATGGLRAHQNSACLRQTGVSMHCITSWMFTCYCNFTTNSRKDLAGSLGQHFCTKKKRLSGSTLLLLFYFPCFLFLWGS